MAIYKTDIITAKDSLSVSDKSLDGAKTGATVLQATAVYTMTGAESSYDIIELTDLPPSATVVPENSYVAFGYPGGFSAGWITLGDSSNPERYGSTLIDFNADQKQSNRFGYSANYPMAEPQPYDKATRLVARFSGTPSARVAGGKIVFGISYTIKG